MEFSHIVMIFAVIAVVVWVEGRAAHRRREKRRDEFRHAIGAKEWWGRR